MRLPTCQQCSGENKQGETTHQSAVLKGKQARRDYPPVSSTQRKTSKVRLPTCQQCSKENKQVRLPTCQQCSRENKQGETTHLSAVLKGKQARRDYPPSVDSAQGKTSKARLPALCRQCSRENKQGKTTHPLSAVLEGKQARQDYPPSVGSARGKTNKARLPTFCL